MDAFSPSKKPDFSHLLMKMWQMRSIPFQLISSIMPRDYYKRLAKKMIGITQQQRVEIIQILTKFVPESTVWAFGSHITMTAREFSDLDLVVIDEDKIPLKQFYMLKDAFEESELSIKVDILDWHRLSYEFQTNIKKQYEKIYPPD